MPKICAQCGGSGFKIEYLDLRQRRVQKELSASEVARRMGISVSYYNDLERGRKNWDSELLAKFNQALAQK